MDAATLLSHPHSKPQPIVANNNRDSRTRYLLHTRRSDIAHEDREDDDCALLTCVDCHLDIKGQASHVGKQHL